MEWDLSKGNLSFCSASYGVHMSPQGFSHGHLPLVEGYVGLHGHVQLFKKLGEEAVLVMRFSPSDLVWIGSEQCTWTCPHSRNLWGAGSGSPVYPRFQWDPSCLWGSNCVTEFGYWRRMGWGVPCGAACGALASSDGWGSGCKEVDGWMDRWMGGRNSGYA